MKQLAIALLLLVQCHLLKAQGSDLRYEAESCTLNKCEIVSDRKYSGGKAVKVTDEAASLTLKVNVNARQKYNIYIMAEGIGSEKVVNCSVNGATTAFKTNTYKEVNVGSFIFMAGTNTLKITPSWTWFNIDYIRLSPTNDNLPFSISTKPVTPDATEAAQKLYTFLYDNFGKRTLSGIMTGSMDTAGKDIRTHEDPKAVFTASGHYPALVGFDFSNATGKDVDAGNTWFTDYMRKAIVLAKDLWARGGVPDFTWHWHDPSRVTGDFYTEKTSFNFTTALKSDGSWNTSSTTYKYLIKDIDTVADYFLELQDEGIACIFRPLHEAPGGWFWWGTQGAAAYVKLYRLIYDEMVKVKGVRNVLWDWNADYTLDLSWCPGEGYYDIISTDIYNSQYDYSSNYSAFDKLKVLSSGKKLIALAENGPIPDIDKMADEEAMWSWWMPWYQSWGGNFVSKTSNAEWQKCMSDPRVLTLDRMPGWDASSSIEVIETLSPTHSTLYDLQGHRVTKMQSGTILFGKDRKILLKE